MTSVSTGRCKHKGPYLKKKQITNTIELLPKTENEVKQR